MDKLIYTLMNGARHTMHAQSIRTQNLVNSNTDGYRAYFENATSAMVEGGQFATRINTLADGDYTDYTPGVIKKTGRDLDVAVSNEGFIAVQTPKGEAYTRTGSFKLNAERQLITKEGYPVLSNAGVLVIPDSTKIDVSAEGFISIRPRNGTPNDLEVIGRIKLAKPPTDLLRKEGNGYFYRTDGLPSEADPTIQVASQSLEGSNVDPLSSIVDIMAFARQHELHYKMMRYAHELSKETTQLMDQR